MGAIDDLEDVVSLPDVVAESIREATPTAYKYIPKHDDTMDAIRHAVMRRRTYESETHKHINT